jgi:hypothetical protein
MRTFDLEGVTYYPFRVRYVDQVGTRHKATVYAPGDVDAWLGPATRETLSRRHGSLTGLRITSIGGDRRRRGVP